MFAPQDVSVGNADVAQHQELAQYDPRGSYTIVAFFSAQEGPGGVWDSVKKAAVVIGSGILFLAAFGNSLTW